MRRIDKIFYKKILLTSLITITGFYIFSILFEYFSTSHYNLLMSLKLMFSFFLALILFLSLQIFWIYKDRRQLKSLLANKETYKKYNIIDIINHYKHPIINNKNGEQIDNIIIDYKMQTSDYNLEPQIKKLRAEKNLRISDIESFNINYHYPTLIKLSNDKWYAISKDTLNKKDTLIYLIDDTSFFIDDFYSKDTHYIEIQKPQLFRNH